MAHPPNLPGFPPEKRRAGRLRVKAGTTVFRMGEPGYHAFIILSGTVQIDLHLPSEPGGGRIKLGKGDIFGEYSLIMNDGKRSASAYALTDLELRKISRDDFNERFQTIDPFYRKWIKRLILRGSRS